MFSLLYYIKNAKKCQWLLVGLWLFCALDLQASLSGKYTINQNANASATNYKSFSALASDLSTGIRTDAYTANGPAISGAVIIDVVKGSGPYYEQVAFDAILGTNATQTITINGNGEKLSFNTNYTQLYVLRLNGADYMIINGLVIESTNATYARCIEIRNESNNCNIVNCDLKMPYMTGTSDVNGYIMVTNGTTKPTVYTNPGKNITIKNNRMNAQIDGGPYYGVWLCNETNGTASTGYQIIDNNIENVYYTFIHAAYTVETLIEKNRLHNDKHTRSGYLYGIYLYNYYTRCDAKIASNWLYEFNNLASSGFDGRYPIYVYMYGAPNAQPLDIVNNILDIKSNYYTPGIYVYAYSANNANINLLHNTLHFGGKTINNYAYGLYMTQMYYTNVACKNNIFYCDWNIAGPLYANYFVSGTIDFENNLIYLNDVSGNGTAYNGYNGNNYQTLNDWESAVGGKDNINADPLLANPDNYDWQPTSLLAANKGQYSGINFDIQLNSRNTKKPDIGAIEYAIDVKIYDAQLPNLNYCSNQSALVSFWVKNNSSNLIKKLPMAFSLNNSEQFTQVFEITLKSKDSILLVFENPAQFHDGVSSNLKVYLKGNDDDSFNNSSQFYLNISKSPSGGSLSKGKLYNAHFEDGTYTKPDVTIANLPIGYEIENPTGFLNSNYGLNWKLETYCRAGNITIDSGVLFSKPFGTAKATIEFTPTQFFEDSMVFIGVKAINLSNGCDSIFGRWVYVVPSPKVKFFAKNACEGELVEFKNETIIAKGELLYKWDFGDTFTTADSSDYLNPIYKYASYGTYVPTLQVKLKKYPTFNFNYSQIIEISPVPNIDFAPINACQGEPINFYNNTTIIGGNSNFINFNWDFGDGIGFSKIKYPAYQYANAGSYKVQLTAEYNGCLVSRVRNANQFALPEASFNIDESCNLTPIEFKNSSKITLGNIGFSWRVDNSFLSTLKNPTFTFDSSGNHTIKLFAISEFGCLDSIEKIINLKESPVALFDFTEPCNREFIKFKNNSKLNSQLSYQYFWNFSNEGSTNVKEPEYLFKGLGYKDVSLTIQSSNGCSNAITHSFLVKRQAKADFEANDVCEGEPVQFTNRSNVDYGAIDFEWRFGDGNSSNLTSPKKTFTISGNSRTYLVTLVAKVNDGCSDSITKPITINAKSNSKFNYKISGRFVSFEPIDSNSSYTYNWRFGEGTRSTLMKPLHEYQNIDFGKYEACLGVVNNANCLSESCEEIFINLIGVDQLEKTGVLLYPNPTKKSFTIQLKTGQKIEKIAIFDVSGKPIDFNIHLLNSEQINIFFDTIVAGFYFIELQLDDKTLFNKIVIE